MKTIVFKNWRTLLFLFLILFFFGSFAYFFIIEKNIIQFLPKSQQKSLSKKTKVFKEIKSNAKINHNQKLNWKTLKVIFQKFLNNLKFSNDELMDLTYQYQTRNLYQFIPRLNRANFEKMIIYEISQKIAFYDLKIIFEYDNDLITVKITIIVDNKLNQKVSQTYRLQTI